MKNKLAAGIKIKYEIIKTNVAEKAPE